MVSGPGRVQYRPPRSALHPSWSSSVAVLLLLPLGLPLRHSVCLWWKRTVSVYVSARA